MQNSCIDFESVISDDKNQSGLSIPVPGNIADYM